METWNRKLVVAATLIAAFLAFGTFFYHYAEGWSYVAEGWSYVDSFYFSGVTLTTVGYGDFMPTTPLTKIVTVFFAFAGIGIVFYSIGLFAQRYFEREEERVQKMWEAAQTVGARAKLPLDISSVRLGNKAVLLRNAQKDQKRTVSILRKKSRE